MEQISGEGKAGNNIPTAGHSVHITVGRWSSSYRNISGWASYDLDSTHTHTREKLIYIYIYR